MKSFDRFESSALADLRKTYQGKVPLDEALFLIAQACESQEFTDSLDKLVLRAKLRGVGLSTFQRQKAEFAAEQEEKRRIENDRIYRQQRKEQVIADYTAGKRDKKHKVWDEVIERFRERQKKNRLSRSNCFDKERRIWDFLLKRKALKQQFRDGWFNIKIETGIFLLDESQLPTFDDYVAKYGLESQFTPSEREKRDIIRSAGLESREEIFGRKKYYDDDYYYDRRDRFDRYHERRKTNDYPDDVI